MDSARKIDNYSVDLGTFLNHYEYRLPATVKIVEGFRGTNSGDTLEVDQVFYLYKVERQKTIVARDQLGQEICLQQNSKHKVHLLPLEFHDYNTVKELLTAQWSYFLVLEDIQSPLQIVSGSKLILPTNRRSIPDVLKCQIVDHADRSREVLLPLHLKGRFLPLLTVKDFYLEEVLAHNELPANIRFVSEATEANDRLIAQSLTSLGNIRLTRKTDMEMVFASSYVNELTLYLFPKTLDISVTCGFKVSAETGKKIKDCKNALETSEMSLKMLDNELKGSFYFMACPVRSFSVRSLKMPPVPLPRLRRAKQGKPSEDLSGPVNREDVNREETTNSDLLLSTFDNCCSFVSGQKPVFHELQEERDYEICEWDEMSISIDCKSVKEMNPCSPDAEVTDANAITAMEIPPLPPKSKSLLSTGEDSSTVSLSPKPRKRFSVAAKAMPKEISKEFASQSQDGTFLESLTDGPRAFSENHVDKNFPELPPKAIFLKAAHIDSEEKGKALSQEDNPPQLPPKKLWHDEQITPEKEHIQNEEAKKQPAILQDETPPPLPPKYVMNNKEISLKKEHIHNEPVSRGKALPALSPREKSFDENHLDLAYLVVDVTDWKKIEENYDRYAEVKDDGCVFKQGDADNSYIDVIYDPDDTDYPVKKEQKPQENGEKDRMDVYETPCDEVEGLRTGKTHQVEEPESNENDQSYEEVTESHEPSQWEFRSKKDVNKRASPGGKSPSKASMINSTQTRRETEERPLPREACLQSAACQQVEEESSDDDQSYEEVDDSHEISPREYPKRNSDEAQKKPGVKKPSTNSRGTKDSSSRRSRSSRSSSTEHSAQTSREKTVTASLPRNNNSIWISARREDDCMDFKDIEHFFKLRAQLNAARAQVEGLKQQVAAKEQDSTERAWRPSDDKAATGSKGNVINSKHVEMNSKDKNDNKLVSTKKSGKQATRNSQNGAGLGDGSGKNTEKRKLNSPSSVPKNIVRGFFQEREMSKPVNKDSDVDDDVYEECYERKYINQEISVENTSTYYVNAAQEEQSSGDSVKHGTDSSYYNTAEIEASRYLHFGNPNDGNKNVYLNDEAQESYRDDAKENPAGTKKVSNYPCTFKENVLGNEASFLGSSAFDGTANQTESRTCSGGQESGIIKPPPVPPKKHGS